MGTLTGFSLGQQDNLVMFGTPNPLLVVNQFYHYIHEPSTFRGKIEA